MADSPAFCWVCEEIERVTCLNRLEARGTVRLTLKEAGFDPGSVNRVQMRTILEKMMPGQLESKGIEEASSLCSEMAAALDSAELGDGTPVAESPEEIFQRLGGSG
jgi:hypothetical protein